MLTYTVSNIKGKPTNSEFIAMIADSLTLRQKQATKAAKKLEKERAKKLKALRRLEKKAQKERRQLEKYIQRELNKSHKK